MVSFETAGGRHDFGACHWHPSNVPLAQPRRLALMVAWHPDKHTGELEKHIGNKQMQRFNAVVGYTIEAPFCLHRDRKTPMSK